MFIPIVALAIAFVVIVVGLLSAVLYYYWRLRDSHRTLFRIIRENLRLHEQMEKESHKL